MRAWFLVFCLFFSACRPTAAQIPARGSSEPSAGPIQSLYFLFKGNGVCAQRELTAAFGSFRLYATPYSEISSRAPGRIGELRLPASVARGGNDSARFLDGARLISFDPVHRALLLSVTRDRLVRLSVDGGFREVAATEISPEAERSVLWWETSETDIGKVASEIEQSVRSEWEAAERAKRDPIGLSKTSRELALLEEDSETHLYVERAGISQRSQYIRTYLRGHYVSEAVTDDPLEAIRQVRWVPVSRATADPRCRESSDLKFEARSIDIGTKARPLFVDLIGSPETATRLLIFFNGGPSAWNRRPQDTQYIAPLLADRRVAIAEIAYSGSSGSGLATFNRLRAETPARAISGDASAVARWLGDKHAPVIVVGASFGSAFATSLAAILGAEDHRCVKLALLVPLVAHSDAAYRVTGRDPAYQRAFERAVLGPDLARSWQQYDDVSKHSLDAPNRPPTTFMVAEHDEMTPGKDVLPFVRPGRDALVQVTGSHATAGADPKVSAALRRALASCVR